MKRFLLAACMVGALAPAILFVEALAVPEPTLHQVHIREFKFEPAKITVKPGDSVEFRNDDFAPHTATANDKSFDTQRLEKDGAVRIRIDKAGVYGYSCRFHPAMTGEITVQ